MNPPVDVQLWQERVVSILDRAEALEIQSQEDLEAAAGIVRESKRLENEIVAYFKPQKQELDARKRKVLADEHQALAWLERFRTAVDPKILDYNERERARVRDLARQQDEARRRAAEDAQIQKAERLAAQGSTKAGESLLGVPVVVAPTPVVMPKAEGVSEVRRWKFRVIDKALLPMKFLTPDEKMLQSYATALKDQAELPGVEFWCESSLSVRASVPAEKKYPWSR